ncbi:hypothetical protein DdX_20427 [Ditylenchus destructor]|uniref:Uncharacterized protein n=1 Tax=Ditylenchus destructor TaxID=166010 RepID=A0AAD4MGD4_9BILA|nr:hypothetical protein DdX_20427 [Ditylenchus destructor]
MGYIISKFQSKLQSILNFTLPLKRRTTKYSIHALSLDILEEIFLFVPYECCQNSWIASSKLQIPLASKLKRLHQYQEWIQEQINLLAERIEVLKASTAEMNASIAEMNARTAELKASTEVLKVNTEQLKVNTKVLNVNIENTKVNIEVLKKKCDKEFAALKPKIENCEREIVELEEANGWRSQ